MINFGMCFSRSFEGTTPLSHIGKKRPVYIQLLEACRSKGWEVYVLTRKTYVANGNFNGAWLYKNGEFKKVDGVIKIDLVFDWVGNLLFPPKGDSLKVVNNREFKELTCNKWEAYLKLKDYMPKTYWVGPYKNVNQTLNKIKTKNIVLKPFNGLRGKGIFIGPKDDLKSFKPDTMDRQFIIQEFVDTSLGIPGVTPGKHDLRAVIANGKTIWCHVRIPPEGSNLANAAQGGNLTEVDYSKVPYSVKEIVQKISKVFYRDYDNPIFSLDFGINKEGTPFIFEINDQIGFPQIFHKGRDIFIKSLVENFSSKI